MTIVRAMDRLGIKFQDPDRIQDTQLFFALAGSLDEGKESSIFRLNSLEGAVVPSIDGFSINDDRP